MAATFLMRKAAWCAVCACDRDTEHIRAERHTSQAAATGATLARRMQCRDGGQWAAFFKNAKSRPLLYLGSHTTRSTLHMPPSEIPERVTLRHRAAVFLILCFLFLFFAFSLHHPLSLFSFSASLLSLFMPISLSPFSSLHTSFSVLYGKVISLVHTPE